MVTVFCYDDKGEHADVGFASFDGIAVLGWFGGGDHSGAKDDRVFLLVAGLLVVSLFNLIRLLYILYQGTVPGIRVTRVESAAKAIALQHCPATTVTTGLIAQHHLHIVAEPRFAAATAATGRLMAENLSLDKTLTFGCGVPVAITHPNSP